MEPAANVGAARARRMTLAEWESLSEDEAGELVDGRLEEEEGASFVHELIVVWLGSLLRAWLSPRGGFVFGSDAKYAVQPSRGRKPDLSVFLKGSKKPPARGAARVPADIMIEVVTPTASDERRDRLDKLHDYAAFGVRWYWIVDPEIRTLEIYELGSDGRYVHAAAAASGTLESVSGCEGLTVNLDALWAEVDELTALGE